MDKHSKKLSNNLWTQPQFPQCLIYKLRYFGGYVSFSFVFRFLKDASTSNWDVGLLQKFSWTYLIPMLTRYSFIESLSVYFSRREKIVTGVKQEREDTINHIFLWFFYQIVDIVWTSCTDEWEQITENCIWTDSSEN